jgi:hypothetical protein
MVRRRDLRWSTSPRRRLSLGVPAATLQARGGTVDCRSRSSRPVARATVAGARVVQRGE